MDPVYNMEQHESLEILQTDTSEGALETGTATEDSPNPLYVPLILRQVFIHLPSLDLINCSEVNRLWNYEARTVLRDLRACVATNKGDRPCCSLLDLNADLSLMTVVPYNGLRLRIPNHAPSLCTKTQADFNFLFNHFKLKVLKIDSEWTNTTHSRCPAVQLMTTILHGKHGDTVEELHYVQFPCDQRIMDIRREGGFPELRTIRFPTFPRTSGSIDDMLHLLLRMLVDSAPKLEILDLEFEGRDVEIAGPDYQLVRNFRFHPHQWHETREFAVTQPKLERLTALAPHSFQDNVLQVWDSLRRILLGSSETLKYLKLELTVLAMLREMNVQPLKNLETLIIDVFPREYQNTVLVDEISCLNFTRLCPKIDCVTVDEHVSTHGTQGMIAPPISNRVDEEGGDSSRIRKLLVQDCLAPDSVVKLAKMFPHVTHLTARSNRSAIYFDLWKSWAHLRSARITQAVTYPGFNLDAEFCGIFPDEVTFLQEHDDEFLQNYHLVPVRPGLSAMNWLKRLHISLQIEDQMNIKSYVSVLQRQSPNFFLSKVTGHFVLSRMKNLVVTVECDTPAAVQHLVPFVNLTAI